MARKMSKTKRARKKTKPSVQRDYDLSTSSDLQRKPFLNFLSQKNLIIIGILIIFLIIWRFRNYFVIASVNGQPVSRFEFEDRLKKQFGEITLENMINERLILAAIREKGILVSSNEINERIKQMEGRLGTGMTLSDALRMQGLTEDTFRRQVEIQLSIEKLFDRDSTVSAKEVDDYIKDNWSVYKNATDTSMVKKEVEFSLRQQKIGQLFNEWFSEIRKKAKIQKFL